MRRLLAAIAALCFGGVLAIAGGYSPAGVTSSITNGLTTDAETTAVSNAVYASTMQGETDSFLWTTGRVHKVKLGEDIDAYIASSAVQDGDVLQLPAGTFTTGDDIDVTKAIGIFGYPGKTIISASASHAIHVTSDNVTIYGLTITNAAQGQGIFVDGRAATRFGNVKIIDCDIYVVAEDQLSGIAMYDSGGCIDGCKITATASNGYGNGLECLTFASMESTATLTIRDVTFTATGNAIVDNYGAYMSGNASAAALTVNMYTSLFESDNSGAADGVGIKVKGANISAYVDGCTFDGEDTDVEQADTSVLTVRNVTLVNNTTSGTVTEDGYVRTEGIRLADGAAVDNIETTMTDDDTHLPTSGAVVDYVAANAGGIDGSDLAYTNVMTLTSAAIQGAIDALASTYGAGRINLTRGTYVMAAGGINVSNNIEIVGSGWGTILDSTGQQQTDDVIDIDGTNVVLRDFKILSDRAGGNAFNQISISDDYVLLSNLRLMTSDDDAVVVNSGADYGRMDNVYVYDPDQNGIFSLGFWWTINNCSVYGSDSVGFTVGPLSCINNCIADTCNGSGFSLGISVVATACLAYNNTLAGFNMPQNFASLTGCTIRDNGNDGVYANGDYISITGCTFDEGGGNNKADISFLNVDYGVISACAFYGAAGQAETAVHLDNSDNCSIVGNTTEGHDTCGIQIDADCDGNLVKGNNTKGEAVKAIINNQPTAPDSYQVGRNIYSDNSGDAHNATPDGMNNNRYNGDPIVGLNAGENITKWDVVYVSSSDGEYHQADADAAGEYPVRGFAVSAGTDGNPLTIIDKGVIRNDDWDWYASSVGKELYLSDTPGGVTTNAQTDAGDCGQVVGWVLSDDEIRVNVSPDYFIQESP